MKSHAYVRRKLPLAGVLARFLMMAFLIFATFNPSYYSISTWLLGGPAMLSIKVCAAFGLALVWLIVLRLALAGLGRLGLVYIGLALLTLSLIEAQFAVLRVFSGYALTLLAELALTIVLTFGLVFSYWVRQASGQSAVVKRPP